MPEAHIKPCYMLEHPKAQGATNEIIPVDEERSEMDNQQVTQLDLGWLAGIIDGEGYIGFQVYKTRHNHHSVSVELSITNTDEPIIVRAREIIRKIGINPYINNSAYKLKNKPNHKNVWKLVIHRLNTVNKALKVISPYMTGAKQERALLVIEYCDLRMKNFISGSHSKNVMSEREAEIVDICIAMQKRGTSETIRKAQLEKSELAKEISLRSIQKKKEYNKEWSKNNRDKRNASLKKYREKNREKNTDLISQFNLFQVDDDIVRPFVKA